MTGPEILQQIRQTGHWRIELRPLVYDRNRLASLTDCWAALDNAQVRLRGYYPELDGTRTNLDTSVESALAGGANSKYLRLFQSGQFIHYFPVWEDFHQVPWESSRFPNGRPDKYLEIVATITRITEVFEFASRLAQRGVLSPNALVSISLRSTAERELVFWRISRFLSRHYRCASDEVVFHREYSQEDLVGGSRELALTAIVHVFERFNWLEPPVAVFAEDQRKLFEKEE